MHEKATHPIKFARVLREHLKFGSPELLCGFSARDKSGGIGTKLITCQGVSPVGELASAHDAKSGAVTKRRIMGPAVACNHPRYRKISETSKGTGSEHAARTHTDTVGKMLAAFW